MEIEIKKSTTANQLENLLILDYAAISSTYLDACTDLYFWLYQLQ